MDPSIQQNIIKNLQDALSPNQNARVEAEKYITALSEQNYSLFLYYLADVIQSEANPVAVRQMAATVIKNSIGKNSQQWINMQAEAKTKIKTCILSTLASKEVQIRKACSLVIAGMVKYDLPNKQWTDIFDVLSSASSNDQVYIRLTAITALGYIFQEINKKDIPGDSILLVLNAIFNILQDQNATAELIIESFKALNDIVAFLGDILKNPNQRNYFFNILKEYLTKNPNGDIRKEALHVFTEFIKTYYVFLADKISEITDITILLLKNDGPENVILTYELWCTICDIEIKKFPKNVDGRNLEATNEFLMMAQRSCYVLFDVIKVHLVSQDYDSDEWTISNAAAALLSLLTQCTNQAFSNEIINHAGVAIQKPNNEHQLHAAIIEYGCLLESAHHDYLIGSAKNGVEIIVGYISSPQSPFHIKLISALTLKKVCELYSNEIGRDRSFFCKISKMLMKLLEINDNRIVVQICCAFTALAQGVPTDDKDRKNVLSLCYTEIVEALYSIIFKTESYNQTNNVALAAFIAFGAISEHTCPDMVVNVNASFLKLLSAFEYTFQNEGFASNEARLNYQIYILATLSTMLPIAQVPDEKIANLFNLTTKCFNERKEILPEGLQVMGSIASVLGTKIVSIMDTYGYFLVEGLKCMNMKETCIAAVSCLDETIRALQDGFSPYVEKFTPQVLTIMMNPEVDNEIKPITFNIITDLFIYCKTKVLPGIDDILNLIKMALTAAATIAEDSITLEYFISLRENIIETLSVIFQTCRENNCTDKFSPYVPFIMTFLNTILKENYSPTFDIMKSSLALIADFCVVYHRQLKPLLDMQIMSTTLAKVSDSQDEFSDEEIKNQYIQYVRNNISTVVNN